MEKTQRVLYLIPSTLGASPVENVIPSYNISIINTLQHFVVENIRSARRFLIRCGYKRPIDEVVFFELNEHTTENELPGIMDDTAGFSMGLISEAGLPAVADPGNMLINAARRRQIRIVPLAGPSSLLMALMASGLNGQNFAFNGYLPVKGPERVARIRNLERRSETENQSQIFIETPYRNNQMVISLLEGCKPHTNLCIAVDITLPGEWIMTCSMAEWKLKPPPDLKNKPAVFILQG
jgi:16S rRNA (cytidine1402-2'-O)-methyltransferase